MRWGLDVGAWGDIVEGGRGEKDLDFRGWVVGWDRGRLNFGGAGGKLHGGCSGLIGEEDRLQGDGVKAGKLIAVGFDPRLERKQEVGPHKVDGRPRVGIHGGGRGAGLRRAIAGATR